MFHRDNSTKQGTKRHPSNLAQPALFKTLRAQLRHGCFLLSASNNWAQEFSPLPPLAAVAGAVLLLSHRCIRPCPEDMFPSTILFVVLTCFLIYVRYFWGGREACALVFQFCKSKSNLKLQVVRIGDLAVRLSLSVAVVVRLVDKATASTKHWFNHCLYANPCDKKNTFA